ncbi:MAG: hypothetical protein ACLVML_06470 [Candidatus Gastranaerophilaceae bacterium]|nr:hypothetical protein [Christensenellales bacterium]
MKSSVLKLLNRCIYAIGLVSCLLALFGFLNVDAAVIGAALGLFTAAAGIVIIKRTGMKVQSYSGYGKAHDSMTISEMKARLGLRMWRIADAGTHFGVIFGLVANIGSLLAFALPGILHTITRIETISCSII